MSLLGRARNERTVEASGAVGEAAHGVGKGGVGDTRRSTVGGVMSGVRRSVAAVAAAAAAVAATIGASASDGAKPPGLEFLGQAIVPTGTTFAGTTVGGLSSITYDRSRGVFYSLSDDQGQFQPARFYTLRADVSDGRLTTGDVSFTGVTTLQAPNGLPYAPLSLDPEGLTLAKDGELIVTSEGIAANGIAPFVRRYALDGTFLGDLPVPGAFIPTSATHGVRQNLAFEAAAVAPEGRHRRFKSYRWSHILSASLRGAI